jgi:signal transduction histidine kinase
MAVFAGSVLLLLGFIYWSTVAFIANQTNASIKTEITWLAELYREQGMESLVSMVAERSRGDDRSDSLYAVSGPGKKILAGNLLGLPEADQGKDGWINFSYGDFRAEDRVLQVRGRSLRLTDDYYLFVGRDIRENIALQQVIVHALLWGLAIMIALGLFGGVIMSRRVLRHIEHINQATREIMAGDLSRRIPVNGSADDFDQLATNLNAMLDEIARLMAGIRHVSNNIAHDLRTPLTRLRNQLEALGEGLGNDSPHSQQVERSIADADRLLSTFSGLLRIARIEAGGLKENIKMVNLASLIQDAVELYEAVAEVKQIQVSTEVNDVVSVLGDRDMLFQAVANLLDNAIKYTQQGGKVVLKVALTEQQAEIEVADNGPGIPAFEYDKVVQRFYRLDQSRNTAGNGLGLSLVEAVVKTHQASLIFSDNEPGLRVTIRFKPQSSPHIS